MNDAICDRCGDDNLTDLPVCPSCAEIVHFEHRACVCSKCCEPTLRLVSPAYVTEIKRACSDEPGLRADMLSELREVA